LPRFMTHSTTKSIMWRWIGIFLLFSHISLAEKPSFRDLPYQAEFEDPPAIGTGYYLYPNERYPQKAQDLYANAISGALISVGTERGLINAALFRNVTHIIQIDRDPQAVFFNQINLALLKYANSREEYLFYRLLATSDQWFFAGSNSDDHFVKMTLKNVQTFQWWNKNVRENRNFSEFHRPPARRRWRPKWLGQSIKPFQGGHYLYDDSAYKRLQKLARSDRIAILEFELQDTERFLSLVDWLESIQIPLSVIDISNTWWPGYAGADAIIQLANSLAEREQNKSRIIYSAWVRPETADKLWAYGGVEISEITNIAKRERFALYLQNLDVRMRAIGIDPYEINSINAFNKSSWMRYIGCESLLWRIQTDRKY
jgi:hypothetical protein